MQLYRCNRCKREIHSPICTYESKINDISHNGRGDLCLNCYKDFMEWLDEGVSSDTDVSKTRNEKSHLNNMGVDCDGLRHNQNNS